MIKESEIDNPKLEYYNHRILDVILDLNQQVEDLEYEIKDLEGELWDVTTSKKEEVTKKLIENKRVQITTINPIRRRLINLHNGFKK